MVHDFRIVGIHNETWMTAWPRRRSPPVRGMILLAAQASLLKLHEVAGEVTAHSIELPLPPAALVTHVPNGDGVALAEHEIALALSRIVI